MLKCGSKDMTWPSSSSPSVVFIERMHPTVISSPPPRIESIISRIGFKSVFHITVKTCIFSNGYQIRFNEEPCSQCNIGYIVPEWVNDNSTLSTIKQIYGSDTLLLTTTIGFPLKPDKIKRLSVKEDNEDPRLNSVSVVSISSETNFVTTKNNDAQSYTLHL
ncbi:hypothetical protein ACSBR1_035470 [Camellia fascicularis]